MADVKQALYGQDAFWGRTVAFGANTLDASGERIAYVYSISEAATLTHAGFRYGVRTGTPPTYRISLQSLDATGLPSSTVLGGGSAASATFTPPADATWNSTWQWIALDNSLAVARGDLICIVIEYSSGTINAGNSSSFTRHATQQSSNGIPYSLTHDGASWTKQAASGIVAGVKSASKTFGYPWESFTNATVTTNGHKLAMKLTRPAGAGDTFTIVGLRFNGRVNASGTYVVGVWNAAGTAQQSVTLDSDAQAAPAASDCAFEVFFSDVSLTALSYGTTYYCGIQHDGVTVGLTTIDYDSSAEMTASHGGGDCCLSTWSGASWADTDNKRPIVEPIFADETEPSSTTVVVPVAQPVFVGSGPTGAVAY